MYKRQVGNQFDLAFLRLSAVDVAARRPPQAGLYRIRIRSTMKPDYKLVAKAKYIHLSLIHI